MVGPTASSMSEESKHEGGETPFPSFLRWRTYYGSWPGCKFCSRNFLSRIKKLVALSTVTYFFACLRNVWPCLARYVFKLNCRVGLDGHLPQLWVLIPNFGCFDFLRSVFPDANTDSLKTLEVALELVEARHSKRWHVPGGFVRAGISWICPRGHITWIQAATTAQLCQDLVPLNAHTRRLQMRPRLHCRDVLLER